MLQAPNPGEGYSVSKSIGLFIFVSKPEQRHIHLHPVAFSSSTAYSSRRIRSAPSSSDVFVESVFDLLINGISICIQLRNLRTHRCLFPTPKASVLIPNSWVYCNIVGDHTFNTEQNPSCSGRFVECRWWVSQAWRTSIDDRDELGLLDYQTN